MPVPDSPPLALIVYEYISWSAGIVFLWRLLTGRLGSSRAALAPWLISLEGFVIGILLVIGGAIILPNALAYLGNDVLGPAGQNADWWLLAQGAAFQLGMLGGATLAALYLHFVPGHASHIAAVPSESNLRTTPTRQPILAGTITFLIALPLINGIGYAWKALLAWMNFSVSEQSMVDLFRSTTDIRLLVFMIVLAVVVAPVTEEIIFRAGLFRYLRTRVTRAFAMILPAFIFAYFHDNLAAFLPLLALGVLFAFAYERTGRISVPIIAHALFNLNTIVLAMSGAGAKS